MRLYVRGSNKRFFLVEKAEFKEDYNCPTRGSAFQCCSHEA